MKCTECENENIHGNGLCQKCYSKQYHETHKKQIQQRQKQHYASNRDKIRERQRRYYHTHYDKPASENKQCFMFLGVHVAERVLSKVFKDVERMPYGNVGFDFFCNQGKKIDVKSTCTRTHDKWSDSWGFHIGNNRTADYFLCIAFDNREDLNPLHIWLIPAEAINHQKSASISKSALSKWDKYKLDINKVIACCDSMKHVKSKPMRSD